MAPFHMERGTDWTSRWRSLLAASGCRLYHRPAIRPAPNRGLALRWNDDGTTTPEGVPQPGRRSRAGAAEVPACASSSAATSSIGRTRRCVWPQSRPDGSHRTSAAAARPPSSASDVGSARKPTTSPAPDHPARNHRTVDTFRTFTVRTVRPARLRDHAPLVPPPSPRGPVHAGAGRTVAHASRRRGAHRRRVPAPSESVRKDNADPSRARPSVRERAGGGDNAADGPHGEVRLRALARRD